MAYVHVSMHIFEPEMYSSIEGISAIEGAIQLMPEEFASLTCA